MFTISSGAKVYLSLTKVDFRKQIEGLKKWIKIEMNMDPFTNAYFFFISKNKKAIKVLHFDGQGLGLYTKRLSVGKFRWWEGIYDASLKYIDIKPLVSQVILMNGNSHQLQIQKNWKEL